MASPGPLNGIVMDSHPLNYQFDDVEVRPGSFEVVKAGSALALEPKSIRVLLHLLENRDRTVTKEELFQAVWRETAVTDNALTRVIAQLRRELGDDARQPRYIQTVPTLGYRFVSDVRMVPNGTSAGAKAKGSERARVLTLGAALAILAAIGSFLLSKRLTSKAADAPDVRQAQQLTTSSGLDMSPSFSPDGRSIAYSSDRSGRFEIYARPIQGNLPETQLTTGGDQNVQPVWSPDGQSIAYHSVVKGGIWIVPAAGGQPRQVTKIGSQPAWSPDSAQIAYRSEDMFSLAPTDLISTGKSAIFAVSAAGGVPRRLTSPKAPDVWHVFPSWSPDGSRILFAAYSNREAELWTARTDGSGASRIASLASAVYFSPIYSANGDRIFYATYSRAREFGIWQIRLKRDGNSADGEPIELTRSGTTMPRDLTLSRDGKHLAYTSSTMSSNLWRLMVDASGNAKGGASSLYKDVVFRTSSSSFSPDGQRVAFFARLFGGQGNIWLINADGSGAFQLTDSPGMDMMPSWTPDSSAVVYMRHTKSGAQLWRKSISDRSETVVADGRQVAGWPRLSRQGTEVAYHRVDGGIANLWSLSIRTGETRQLTHDAEGAGFPAWSPDGRLIAFQLTRGENSFLATVDRDGRNLSQLNSDPVHNWCFSWSPDGRKILFAGFRDGAWNLWWIDRVTRQQHKLTDYRSLASFVRYPEWSPKGDQIVFEYSATHGNIYVVDLR